ncbi:MerR family transcriptional regulator [Azohydromonas caseinilytica]|uniref:MerR family transcriptional regulator n=1 Tax=Azohydromonas caseinilytica TaxID=2728836 RepID=A0A848FI83_9BURK|nr:MerR family transcriptional regulator [Azohydromonas caseinilytica]NML18585.1 MerR family transcriptional regulator [Azohydromonas caseinilytica]
MSTLLSIADVERDTGLAKDTLRVWERRYGFPQPQRDALGERLYAPEQVEKLRLIRRLIDAGHRPGRLVPQPVEALQALLGGRKEPAAARAQALTGPDEVGELLALLRRHDAAALRQALTLAEARHGLRGFVTGVVAPLAQRVGEAWMQGELRIFEEHLYTESVQAVLHAALAALPPAQGRPRVLLATLPGEPHGLGLLMAQALLALEGCACLSLGTQVPLDDLVAAAAAWQADVVALSVTGCQKRNLVLASLAQLRAQMPAERALWVGGAAPALGRGTPPGIRRVAALEDISEALAPWRAPAPPAA